jgi:hypothetical protein
VRQDPCLLQCGGAVCRGGRGGRVEEREGEREGGREGEREKN